MEQPMSLADTIIPLMGSVSMDRAEAVRKACDGLEERIDVLERASKLEHAVSKMHGTLLGEVYGKMSVDQRATTNTGEQRKAGEGCYRGADAGSDHAEAAEPRDREPSPAPSASEIPAWVPSSDAMRQACGESAPGEHWNALRRLIASRAPAQPSVEEMAERLLNAQLKHYGLSPRAWAQVDEEERAYWLALARAAIGGGK